VRKRSGHSLFESVRIAATQTCGGGEAREGVAEAARLCSLTPRGDDIEQLVKGLILAQNERWRRGLGMQVERIPGATPGEVAKGAVRRG
jgi:hypothetical protein